MDKWTERYEDFHVIEKWKLQLYERYREPYIKHHHSADYTFSFVKQWYVLNVLVIKLLFGVLAIQGSICELLL